MKLSCPTKCLGHYSVLTVLLLCLCFSRGEGLHLLPFAGPNSTGENSAKEFDLTNVRTSETHRAAAIKEFSKKLDKSNPLTPAAARESGDRRAETPGLFEVQGKVRADSTGPTKFELTASSDRSPPQS